MTRNNLLLSALLVATSAMADQRQKVVSAVKGLMDKDFVTMDKGEYHVYDLFFQLWLERRIWG